MPREVITSPQMLDGVPIWLEKAKSGRCGNCGLAAVYPLCTVCSWLGASRDVALAWARSTKFECGPFCQFCESDAETVLCDWPALKPTAKAILAAEVGDLWITEQKGKRGRIVEIIELDALSRPTDEFPVKRQIWVAIPKHPDPYPYIRFCSDTFLNEGLAACNQQACFRHFREVGNNRHYCRDHWDSWQQISGSSLTMPVSLPVEGSI